MNNLVTKPVREIDGFESYVAAVEGGEEQQAAGVIQGERLSFTNEAKWVKRDGELIPSDLELVAVDVARVVQKWQGGRPAETIVLAPGQKFPDLKQLNAHVPTSEWETGPAGPRGPWQAQHILYLLNPESMDRFTYPTATMGGGNAIRDLVDRTKWMRRYRGGNVCAVVTLGDTFMPTRFGGRQRPHFRIQRWISLFGGGAALPAPDTHVPAAVPDQHQSASGGAQTVEPPTLSEEMGDAIKY